MNLPTWPLWVVDVLGASLLIALTVASVREAGVLAKERPDEVVWTYLYWFMIVVAIFALSRSIAHLLSYVLFVVGRQAFWETIRPFTGAFNTLTFVAVAVLTLFYGRVAEQNERLASEIADRKAAEAELRNQRDQLEETVAARTRSLREQRERLNLAVEGANLGVWDWDMESDTVTFNEQWAEMLGLSLDEIEPTLDTWEQRVHPEDIDAVQAALNDHIAGETDYYDTEHRMQTAGGEWKWVRDIGRVVERNEDNEPIRAVGIHIDITYRKEREQQIKHLTEDLQESLQQLKVIDRVLRHNFHNDMNVILGHAENIQETSSGAAAVEAATIIETGEKFITTVDKQREITDLLSEPEPPETIDLGEVIDAGVAATLEQYPEAQITVESSGDRHVRAIKSIDRALTELLTNAVVHSDQAEPSIEVKVEDRDDAVTVRIADDGPGIPDMERKIVTGEAEIEPLYHGSGLGLWLVTLIVQKSGGSLAFQENDPRGSIVTIRLPKAAVHDGDE